MGAFLRATLALVLVLGTFVYLGHRDWVARESAAAAPAPPSLEEIRFQKVLQAGAAVRAALRNPQSLVYDDVFANNDATIICFQYRAQNGFGGMNREFMLIDKGKPSQSSAAWKKKCAQLDSQDTALFQLNR